MTSSLAAIPYMGYRITISLSGGGSKIGNATYNYKFTFGDYSINVPLTTSHWNNVPAPDVTLDIPPNNGNGKPISVFTITKGDRDTYNIGSLVIKVAYGTVMTGDLKSVSTVSEGYSKLSQALGKQFNHSEQMSVDDMINLFTTPVVPDKPANTKIPESPVTVLDLSNLSAFGNQIYSIDIPKHPNNDVNVDITFTVTNSGTRSWKAAIGSYTAFTENIPYGFSTKTLSIVLPAGKCEGNQQISIGASSRDALRYIKVVVSAM